MVNIMFNNCNHYAPIEIAMVYPLLRHTQISYQVGELYNQYIYIVQHIPCLQMIVQLSPITNILLLRCITPTAFLFLVVMYVSNIIQ